MKIPRTNFAEKKAAKEKNMGKFAFNNTRRLTRLDSRQKELFNDFFLVFGKSTNCTPCKFRKYFVGLFKKVSLVFFSAVFSAECAYPTKG